MSNHDSESPNNFMILDIILDKSSHAVPGCVSIYLTDDEYSQFQRFVASYDPYVRGKLDAALNALRLIRAIADNPERNPDENVDLATKTRLQLDSAIESGEKR